MDCERISLPGIRLEYAEQFGLFGLELDVPGKGVTVLATIKGDADLVFIPTDRQDAEAALELAGDALDAAVSNLQAQRAACTHTGVMKARDIQFRDADKIRAGQRALSRVSSALGPNWEPPSGKGARVTVSVVPTKHLRRD